MKKEEKEYFAFISYQREDEAWAKWLADQLEHYHLPTTLNGRDDLPKNLRPVFRDIDELAAGNLPIQIYQALKNSKNLVVVCSPNSAESLWVNKEVEEFIKMERLDKIFPFIIDGVPFAEKKEEECFPKALRNLSEDKERLGANIKEYNNELQRFCKDCPIPKNTRDDEKHGNISDKGRDAAVVKIVAGMLNLNFDTLWQRYEREKAEEERKIREQRDKLLISQSRFLSEKVIALLNNGDFDTAKLLALEALPPNRPYTVEAEYAIRKISQKTNVKFNEYTSLVKFAIFSPDGKSIVSASDDKTIRIWDVKTRMLSGSPLEGHTDWINSVFFSPNGQYIVSASYDKTVRIWDVKTGQQIGKPLEGHTSLVKFAIFSPDGKSIVSASYDKTIRIWDVKTRMLIGSPLKGHTDWINSVFFSPNGQYIVSASCDKTMMVWDVKTGQSVGKPLKGHEKGVNFASFSPDGKYIVSASDDKTLLVWDINTNIPIGLPLKGHTDRVNSAFFSHDGKYIVSASDDKTIRIWNASTGQIVTIFSEKDIDKVKSAIFSPDGKCIVSVSDDKIVRLWHFPSLNDLIDEIYQYSRNRQLTIEERQRFYLE